MTLVADALLDAAAKFDSSAYESAHGSLRKLHDLLPTFKRRMQLLGTLARSAPAWAEAIRTRQGEHGADKPPGSSQSAWLWRQLSDELDHRAGAEPEMLQRRIDSLGKELRQVTAELVENKAWATQIRRTTLPQRQALFGWLDIQRRIGKGTGRLAPILRREARAKLGECQSAVPVWIMPLARVVESFDPRTTKFDAVIIDEASQSDILSLVALYLGKQVVVVGDHEQVSPAAVGQDLMLVKSLIEENLKGIPNAILYDGRTSVYDLARQSFGGVICLLEHFRCVPDIIQFSNYLSYGGRIKPLRDVGWRNVSPSVIPHAVRGGTSSGKTNLAEILAVASLLIAATEQPEYEGKTFGVISLVGEEQALEIDRLIRRHLPPDEYEARRILCGNAAQFQGDERDVVFLSLVDGPGSGPLAFRDTQMFRQRYNVAASRARDQMWVVHSLDPTNDLKPGDLRRRLIEHAVDPSALVRKLRTQESRAESEFEREVLRLLVAAGYRVQSQRWVGSYRIDIVVESDTQRIAIECDGDRFHPIENLADDMARQAILERLGWRFIRIRGSEFFRNRENTMKGVFEALERFDVHPDSRSAEESSYSAEAHILLERVSRRASELEREWSVDGKGEEDEFADAEFEEEPETPMQPAPLRLPAKARRGDREDSDSVPHYDLDGTLPRISEDEHIAPRSRRERRSREKLVRREDEASAATSNEIEIVKSVGANTWLTLSHWAKVNNCFQAWERGILYTVGTYLKRSFRITDKQARHAVRLYKSALEMGFDPKRQGTLL